MIFVPAPACYELDPNAGAVMEATIAYDLGYGYGGKIIQKTTEIFAPFYEIRLGIDSSGELGQRGASHFGELAPSRWLKPLPCGIFDNVFSKMGCSRSKGQRPL
ncbi:MAG: hypothetical protein F6K41_15195 [Symploca sp. SIO3E6]|nr:hypothetical protein [Caldora sp. SIO3E6]